MAKKEAKKKAAKKSAPKKSAAKKNESTSSGVPAKLVPGKKGAGNSDDQGLHEAVKCIQKVSGEEVVKRGQLSLFLTYVACVTKDAAEARDMMADAVDAGALKAA